MKVITDSYEATQKLGEKFAKDINPGDILLLFGDLGSGKTTFMQGLAKGLGIQKRIISPTFIIVRKYEVPIHPRGGDANSSSSERSESRSSDGSSRQARTIKTLYHIDLYRTQTPSASSGQAKDDLLGLGLPEILSEKDAVVAIEWPEKLGQFLPKKRWELHFKTIDENKRSITINKV